MEEQHAPIQLILGVNDPDFCTLLSLGIYLEHMYPSAEGVTNGKLNCFAISPTPSASKARASRLLRSVFESDDFKELFRSETLSNLDICLGSHSLRKAAATHARRNGCSRDKIDLRGKWKQRRRQVDTYLDATMSFPDAKVAAALCVGGPIMYMLRKDSGLDDSLVCENAVSNIFKSHGCKKITTVLGKAVAWACLDPQYVPADIVKRVENEYERIRTLETNINPAVKMGLVVAGHEGQLFIDQISYLQEGEIASDATEAGVSTIEERRWQQSAEMQTIFSQFASIKRQNDCLQSEL
jgi:predicted ATP-dependent protease